MHDFMKPGRATLVARDCAIATSHHLASAAGLEILAAGGNAVDAALAAVAVQCVVEPHMTGIGGDCFALYAPAGGEVIALNGSGRAPKSASAERLRAVGSTEIPRTSAHAITVPGAISAWMKLYRDHGSLSLDRLFARAIDYAENGYPIAPRVAQDWAGEAMTLAGDEHASRLFLPGGVAPKAGDRHAQPKLGARFRDIVRGGAAAFYTGENAAKMVRHLRSLGGLHTLDDFAAAENGADYVTPIQTNYRGYDVYECPPNGQGVAALMILNILSGFDLSDQMSLADRVHLHAEATKLAYHQRDALVADAAHLPLPVEAMLSEDFAAKLRGRIDMRRAKAPTLWNEPEHKDTIYLCVVDRDGNAISFINSIFHAFGSTRLDPETGVLFHSRGSSFNLREGHPNSIGPGKRPMHTIIPGMLAKGGKVVGPFGVMGGHYQAAGHAAFLSGVIDRGLDVQAAIDAPRAFAFDGILEIEPSFGEAVLADLAGRGHVVKPRAAPMGGAQAIFIDRHRGVLLAGSDQRKDGVALGI